MVIKEFDVTSKKCSALDLNNEDFGRRFNRLFEGIEQNATRLIHPLLRMPDLIKFGGKCESKSFYVTAERRMFEENGAGDDICDALFGSKLSNIISGKSTQEFSVDLWRFREQEGAIILQKANKATEPTTLVLGNVQIEQDYTSLLFWMMLKKPNKIPLKPPVRKDLKINNTNYSAVLKTIETLATQKGLIKP